MKRKPLSKYYEAYGLENMQSYFDEYIKELLKFLVQISCRIGNGLHCVLVFDKVQWIGRERDNTLPKFVCLLEGMLKIYLTVRKIDVWK